MDIPWFQARACCTPIYTSLFSMVCSTTTTNTTPPLPSEPRGPAVDLDSTMNTRVDACVRWVLADALCMCMRVGSGALPVSLSSSLCCYTYAAVYLKSVSQSEAVCLVTSTAITAIARCSCSCQCYACIHTYVCSSSRTCPCIFVPMSYVIIYQPIHACCTVLILLFLPRGRKPSQFSQSQSCSLSVGSLFIALGAGPFSVQEHRT